MDFNKNWNKQTFISFGEMCSYCDFGKLMFFGFIFFLISQNKEEVMRENVWIMKKFKVIEWRHPDEVK